MCDNKNCESKRIVDIYAKSSDLNIVSFNGRESDGYLPYIKNIGGGDDVTTSICLECGKVQGSFPVDDPDYGDDEDV